MTREQTVTMGRAVGATTEGGQGRTTGQGAPARFADTGTRVVNGGAAARPAAPAPAAAVAAEERDGAGGEREGGGAGRPHRQKLTFYHPTASGGGAAMQLEPRLNRRESDRYNCFFLDLAPQKTTASREEGRRVPATFDWNSRITVKLDLFDMAELLAVLEGRAEKAGGQRNGLYHDSGASNTVITFQRATSGGGYAFAVSRKARDAAQCTRLSLLLSEPEATVLRCVLQSAIFFMAFPTQFLGAGREREEG